MSCEMLLEFVVAVVIESMANSNFKRLVTTDIKHLEYVSAASRNIDWNDMIIREHRN